MSVFCLSAAQIDALWRELAPHIDRLEGHGVVLGSAVRADLKEGLKQLWGYQQDGRVLGIAITSVIETPRGKACEIYGGAGTESVRGQIDDVMTEVQRWARELGCTRIRILGRKGWLRRLKGFRLAGYIIEKEI